MSHDEDAASRRIVPLRKGILITRSEALAQRTLMDIARIERSSQPIFDAVADRDVNRVRIILDSDATQANARNSYDQGILWTACNMGLLSIVRLLLDRGARADTDKGDRRNPILTATTHGHAEVVATLLDQGVDIHRTYYQRGETLLHVAAHWSGSADCIKMLVAKGAEVNAADAQGFTPLTHATVCSRLILARALVDAGARLDIFSAAALGLNDAVDQFTTDPRLANARMNDVVWGRKNFTPLHFAVEHGQVSIARLLVSKKADVNSRDKRGWTPLHRAVSLGHLEVVQLLGRV